MEQDPLHGKTLKAIVQELVEYFGWEDLLMHINIICFGEDSTVNSSLKFLRETDWARVKVGKLYITYLVNKY